MMVSIIEAAPWTRQGKRLILQPQKSQGELRRWLSEQGYHINCERVLYEERHWYTLMLVTGGGSRFPLTPGRLEAGDPVCWCREDDWVGFLTDLIQRLTRQKAGLERSCAGGDCERYAYLCDALAELAAWRETLERGVWPV